MARRKIITLALAMVLLLSLFAPASAAPRTITVSPINIMVGGKVFLPTDVNGKDVPVFVYNGTTYAPLRALAEAYGLDVGYNAEKKLASISGSPSGDFAGTKGTKQALTARTNISVSSINIEVNGEVFQPKDANGNPVDVFVYNGTTYAPLRALAEAYGLTVGYDSEKRLATVEFVASAPAIEVTPKLSDAVSPLEIRREVPIIAAVGSVSPYAGVSGVKVTEDLSSSPALAYSLRFSNKTTFSALPDGFDPAALLEWGKYPGLNVDILHKYGFDGRGAVIAYVDQPIEAHDEYKHVNLHYVNNSGQNASMHGPAVLSLLAGKDTGTAPAAEIYYYAHAAWKADQTTHAECLYQIIEQTNPLPADKKITMVGFSDNIDPREANAAALEEAVAACEKAGIMVWFCGEYSTLAFLPMSDKNNPANLMYNPLYCDRIPQLVLVPASGRTGADQGKTYTYYGGDGGVSWTMPYVLGLYSIVLEINPALTQNDLRKLIVDTAYSTNSMRIVNPVEFVAAALDGVGRASEAKTLRDAVAARQNYLYAIMDTAAMSAEDLQATANYLANITDATVLVCDASSFANAETLYAELQADAAARGGKVAGVQIFGNASMVPAFRVHFKVQMANGVDDAGDFLTDLFYGNFNNDPSVISNGYNVMDHFAEKWNVDLVPAWPVARLPLAKGEFAAFFEKYNSFAAETGLTQQCIVNFSNPIFNQKNHIDDMGVFLNRMNGEFGLIDVPYSLYGNLDGDAPVTIDVLGGYTKANLSKENDAGIMELIINSHGQWNNIDQCIFVDGEEQRISFVDMDNINSVLDGNAYYLDCWTCQNGQEMQNNLTTTALNGKCVGMFSASTIISNNGVDCRASLDKMKQSNFYYFYYSYLKALNDGMSRSAAFAAAQKAYAKALIADSVNGIRSFEGNYQFNLINLLSYHNFGVIELNSAASLVNDATGYITQAGHSVPKDTGASHGGNSTGNITLTDGNAVGSAKTLRPNVINKLTEGTLTVHSYTAQNLDNGYIRFTVDYTASEGLSVFVFDPPDGDMFMLRAPSTSGDRETLVFDLSAEVVNALSDGITINFYIDNNNRTFIWVDTSDL